MEFFLPFSALPSNSQVRRELLDEYFPSDLIPFDELIGNQWRIRTFTPNDSSFYIDPNFENALLRWHERVKVEEVGLYWRVYKNSMISFNDSWSLLYWSHVLKWLNEKNASSHITLFHVDDHIDQGPPLLSLNEKRLECVFNGKEVDFSDPPSIEEACQNKSINIRSFITPLIYSISSLDIFHLRYAHQSGFQEKYLACTTEEDPILAQGKQRPIIAQSALKTGCYYCIASTPSSLLSKVKNESILLLHLDCDAFSNRFNGDSNWNHINPTIDWNLPQIKEHISDLFSEIAQLNVTVFLNVALSPGFFPSEYWQDILEHIFEIGTRYDLIREDGFSDYLKNLYPGRIMHEAPC